MSQMYRGPMNRYIHKHRARGIRNGLKSLLLGTAATVIILVGLPGGVLAQEAAITPNYRNVDIGTVIEAVSAVTGKNFIVDPRVKASVTMVSNTPLSADAFYEAFLSILQVYGFVALPAGDVIKILPDANARQMPALDLPVSNYQGGDEIVTQVVSVKNVQAAQLVPILRPLIPQYGHLAAHPASNMLIISDRAANVRRMVKIIQRIDSAGDDDVQVISLEHASAGEVVRVLTSLLQASGPESAQISMVADERTNSVLVSGDRSARLKLQTLVAHLDTPLEDVGNTRVRYLRYSNAVDLATKLTEQVSGAARAAAPAAGGAGTGRSNDSGIIIWAEEETNALIITAPPKTMRTLMAILDKLDIQRAQVSVEAILVAMRFDKAAELGVTWALLNDQSGVGATRFTNTAPGVVELIGAASGDPAAAASAIGTGISLGIGSINDSGTSFAMLLKALNSDSDSNIISTPSVITLDNEEAEIKVTQEVPFRTGQFTNTGGTAGLVNPFTTIERKDVGIVLKITPQINEGDMVMLKIDQEASDIAQSVEGASDLITNKRTIHTTVLVQDGGIVVLGGLTQNTLTETEQRVPILGSIPLVGELFRSRTTDNNKNNLMVFIRPKILRDARQYALETDSKYRLMRDLQQEKAKDGVSLMPGETQTVLPELDIIGNVRPSTEAVEGKSGDGTE
jgi:general secretion pathway protein D